MRPRSSRCSILRSGHGAAARVVPGVALVGLLACSAGDAADPDPFDGVGGASSRGGGSTRPGGAAGSSGSAGSSGVGQGGVPGAAGNASAPPAAGSAGSAGSQTGAAGAGLGGAAGSAGTGGAAAAGASGTGGSSSSTCASGAIVCDDFESATVGAFPDTPAWDPNACTSHRVDDEVAHGGARSLRGGAEQYPACMAHANIAGETEVFARTWIFLGAPSSDSGHEIGFLELGPTLADNPEVRVGVRDADSVCAQAPGVEVTADGIAGGERTSCSGVALDAERWYCLEVHFARAPGSISFGVQIDGSSVVPETTYTDAVAAWNEGPLFLKVGRSSYGGNNVFPVWHDDVVVSSAPVGCAD
jgi:polysaccharide lyase-like protein